MHLSCKVEPQNMFDQRIYETLILDQMTDSWTDSWKLILLPIRLDGEGEDEVAVLLPSAGIIEVEVTQSSLRPHVITLHLFGSTGMEPCPSENYSIIIAPRQLLRSEYFVDIQVFCKLLSW